ncbi:MAG: DEAD/DEAH box helicase family protein [Pseudomonadales bacterium]
MAVPFPHKLVLNRFLLGLFGGHAHELDQDTFREVTRRLNDESLELREEDGSSRFCDELSRMLPSSGPLTREQLLDYDANIVRHTNAISERRGNRLQWKYFQYMTLLFAEVYLDWYFRDPEGLLATLNGHLEHFNNALLDFGESKKAVISPYTPDSLRKLALWNATGSGKTLLMHVNMLQFRHYLAKNQRTKSINRIVLLTSNEGMTRQHLHELSLSGIAAAPFDKDTTGGSFGLFRGQTIDVIDMNKLREEGKKKTVSVDQFETNNLVFIDEAHRGSQGEVWSEMRSRLAQNGFTFEYSATLGQAVGSDAALADEYAKSILFDYSYRYFHADGFGKDYKILNIEGKESSKADSERRRLYLTACLLSYYQQLRVYEDRQGKYKAFSIEKPLWVFVGSKVTAVRTEAKRQVSDVVDILLFLAELVSDRAKTILHIQKLLSGDTGLLDQQQRDTFAEAFPYLVELGLGAQAVFEDILKLLFNAPSGGSLHVEYLTGGDGELALRLGAAEEPFGVVNVGDAKKVSALCEEHPQWLHVSERPFGDSLFRSLSDKDSKLTVLIGSKRFTEGWNSYRVSTLGLMHVGQSEGSEIIQLFGRGVRLKGFSSSLKRSRAIHWATKDKDLAWVAKDTYLPLLETLNVFGVKSDYMERFNEFLDGEGIKKPDDRQTFDIPVRIKLPMTPLITVKVPANINFKREESATLTTADSIALRPGEILLDWYPRVASKASRGVAFSQIQTGRNRAFLSQEHLAFMNFDAIYLELQQLKTERGWHNLNLSREAPRALLQPGNDWYTLYVPPEVMQADSFDKVHEWEEIATALLRKYCERFYKVKKDAYEAPHRIYQELRPTDPNFIDAYKILVDRSEKLIIQRLTELKEHISDGNLSDFNIGGKGESIYFDKHLYSPLLHLRNGVDSDLLSVSPVHLNEGERDFVVDLRAYCQSYPACLEGKEVYLLRNQSKGRGVGFFEAGNFYPDFILWVLDGSHQHVIFVDPKGILRCEGLNDPKLRFFETIKEIEAKLAETDPGRKGMISLHSFIVSNTPLGSVRWWRDSHATEADFAQRHVLFQGQQGVSYIGDIFSRVLGVAST